MFNRKFSPPPAAPAPDPTSIESLLLEIKKDEIAAQVKAKRVQEVLEGKGMTDMAGKYVTGYCETGAHHGAKLFSPSGLRMPTCKGVYDFRHGVLIIKCNCECHTDEFQSALGEPDELEVANPFSAATASIRACLTSITMERRAPQTATTGTPTPDETDEQDPARRKRRGELEQHVYEIVTGILDGKLINPDDSITPQSVVMVYRFTRRDPEYTPSEGAVYAIFRRWAEMGTATLADKPFRLVDISEHLRLKGPDQIRHEIGRAAARANKQFF